MSFSRRAKAAITLICAVFIMASPIIRPAKNKAGGEGKSPIDVFILAGQSNSVGFAPMESLDASFATEFPDIKIYLSGQSGVASDQNSWTTVSAGQGYFGLSATSKDENHFGPELGMAHILSGTGKQAAIIKYGYGGTAIYDKFSTDNWHGPWDGVTPGRLYTGLISSVRTAIAQLERQNYEPRIAGIAWMQGETDGEIQLNQSGKTAAAEYESNLSNLFTALREEFSAPDMPIIFGEIYEYSATVTYVRQIVAAQHQVAKAENNYLVKTGDLVIRSRNDDWHWWGKEMYTLGIRFGEQLYAAVYKAKTV